MSSLWEERRRANRPLSILGGGDPPVQIVRHSKATVRPSFQAQICLAGSSQRPPVMTSPPAGVRLKRLSKTKEFRSRITAAIKTAPFD
jgi:hypothetical protein